MTNSKFNETIDKLSYIFSHDIGLSWWMFLLLFFLTILSIIAPSVGNPVSVFFLKIASFFKWAKGHFLNLFPDENEKKEESNGVRLEEDGNPFRGE